MAKGAIPPKKYKEYVEDYFGINVEDFKSYLQSSGSERAVNLGNANSRDLEATFGGIINHGTGEFISTSEIDDAMGGTDIDDEEYQRNMYPSETNRWNQLLISKKPLPYKETDEYFNEDRYKDGKRYSEGEDPGKYNPIERQTAAPLTKNQKEQWDREGRYEWNLFKK